MNKFGKFFANDKAFLTFFILTLVCFIATIAFTFMSPLVINAAPYAMVVLAIVLFVSFNKNMPVVMHTMIGAILGTLLYSNICSIISNVTWLAVYQPGTDALMTVLSIVTSALIVVLFFNHFSINSAHHSAKSILLNQIIAVILIAFEIVFICVTPSAIPGYFAVANILLSFGIIFVVCMTVSLESRFNAYKLIREASIADGSWTPEKKEATKKEIFHVHTDMDEEI